MVICPECESELDIEEDEVDEGEIVSCTECGSDFEVVAIEPLELTRVEDDDEEEEDDDETTKKRTGTSLSADLCSGPALPPLCFPG